MGRRSTLSGKVMTGRQLKGQGGEGQLVMRVKGGGNQAKMNNRLTKL